MFSARRSIALRRLLLFGGIVIVALLCWHYLPLEDWIRVFLWTLVQLDHLAPPVYIAVYVAATLLMVPLMPLAIGAGYLFGLHYAFAITLPAATLGAVAAFLLSRHLLSRSCRQLIEPFPYLLAAEHSISEQGWLIVFLLRLSPVIPSHILNYLCGLTEIPFRHYLLATFFGKAPLIFALNYMGAMTARSLDRTAPSGAMQMIIYGTGLILTALACWLIVRRARRELQKQGLE